MTFDKDRPVLSDVALHPTETGLELPWRSKVKVGASVLVAKQLARLTPWTLHRVLTFLARRARPARYDEAERAVLAVVQHDPTCAGRFGCLPRSIAACLLLRTDGSWPIWCTGIPAAPPFRAHAWLETEGRLVAELGQPSSYRTLMTMPPPATPPSDLGQESS
ncbi:MULTISPECIES: lasso peptide biosynthesis B2 protein [Rhodococcus]|uniref:lasso peptide biosynthesis B2 protein n=1 Tax=Rhodococcus TaxID=1827 RepID=UPI0026602578|nr:lasso peptide biosynthesis B2 protein [Rhodococcus ruber]MDO1481573.1 lasso peptide biosynthesis B2 protein [Rhodococcus ruber]